MASSNRHWPSMFKSKPCNNQQWSQHHDNNTNNNNHSSSLLSNSCGRSSSTSPFSGGEERSPEPKPRWNPKSEQIRILEAIFNSGMVNPPRDEIRRIRAQLQEYGQVGDANVFYWFQNRKSRSKHKQRSLQAKTTATAAASAATVTATSSSSSSSDKNSPKGKTGSSSSNNSSNTNNNTNNSNNNILGGEHFGNSPTSVNQCNNYFHPLISPPNNNQNHQNFHEFVTHEPGFFPMQQSGASVVGNNFSQGLCFANNNHHDAMMNGGDHSIHVAPPSDQTVGGFSSLLFGDMFSGVGGSVGVGGGGGGQLKRDEVEKFKFQQELSFLVSTPNTTTCTLSTSSPVDSTPTSTAISSSLGQILDVGDHAGGIAGKSTVFINGMAIEVPSAPFNVEEFGEDVILVHATSGHPVLTNEWGVTLHGLQHGASYFLVGGHLVASPLLDKLDSTPDLLASEFPYQI